MEPRKVTPMTRNSAGALLAFVTLLFGGCQNARPLYYWGHYETLAYQSYVAPGKTSPETQIEKLKEDLQKAAAANLPAHPGLHAQLGYLYYQLGKYDEAVKEFEAEKSLFPESAAFMDRMLQQPKAPIAP
jgi:hypothetical protein